MATLPYVLAPEETPGTLLTTTNATETVLAYYRIPSTGAYFFNVKIVAVRTSDYAQAATYWRQALAYRRDSGSNWIFTLRTVGTDNESDANWAVDMDVSAASDLDGDGTNENVVRVLVTGVLATTINWRAVVDVIAIS